MNKYRIIAVVLAIAAMLLMLSLVWGSAQAQAWTPPYCEGPNRALQYGPNGWICVTIAATPLPPQPPPTECITANWNGTVWTCVPTENLTAK